RLVAWFVPWRLNGSPASENATESRRVCQSMQEANPGGTAQAERGDYRDLTKFSTVRWHKHGTERARENREGWDVESGILSRLVELRPQCRARQISRDSRYPGSEFRRSANQAA